MRTLLATCCAAATALTAVTFVAPTPAQAWGYRAYGYRYAPYAYAHAYRPYGYAYAYRPFGFAYAYRLYAYT
jgi:hypothetical protein